MSSLRPARLLGTFLGFGALAASCSSGTSGCSIGNQGTPESSSECDHSVACSVQGSACSIKGAGPCGGDEQLLCGAGGVFEVVVPVVQDTPGTRYVIPLPVELLPFAARKDGFSSIATAFAISPTRFVTAAHVIPLRNKLADRYFLRDAAGRTYPIGQITRYSEYRDLVEFELASAAADVVPLVTRDDPGSHSPGRFHGRARSSWSTTLPEAPKTRSFSWYAAAAQRTRTSICGRCVRRSKPPRVSCPRAVAERGPSIDGSQG
jgi:hypothetical protein